MITSRSGRHDTINLQVIVRHPRVRTEWHDVIRDERMRRTMQERESEACPTPHVVLWQMGENPYVTHDQYTFTPVHSWARYLKLGK